VLDKLRALQQQFPGAVPAKALDELEAFLLHPDWDRRVCQRCQSAGATVEVRRVGPPGGKLRARLLDRSASGLGIRLPIPVPVGSFLEIIPPDEQGTIVIEVRYCRAETDGWLAGCQVLTAAASAPVS